MYWGLSFSCLWGYRKPYQEKGKTYRKKAMGITLAISIVFGAFTEIMQETLIPGRTGSVYDWVADVFGSILGVAFFYFFFQNRNKLKNEAFCK